MTSDWMLKELDAPHEQIVLDIPAGEQNSPEYRKINPMGKVPALVDGDTVVTEVAAICAYLADRFADRGFAPALDSPERGQYYRYLFTPGTTIEPLISVTTLDVDDIKPQNMGWGDMPRVLATVESMTPETGWALGDRFSAADVVFGGSLGFFARFNLIETSPRLAGYLERLQARPAYQASHAAP
jgi:glutathione S-transferase